MVFYSRTLATMLLLLLAPALAAAQGSNQPQSSERPALSLKDMSGRGVSLSDHQGKIVVLNFWATWCVPCREEMPIFVDLKNRYEARGVQIIGASADAESTQNRIPSFVRSLKINFPIWVGVSVDDMQRFGLGDALPATVILDRDGSIAGRIKGVVDKADLQNRIEWLLGDRRSPAPAPLVDNFEKHEGEEHDHHHGDKDDAHKHGEDKGEHDHGHEGEEDHEHGGVGVEGASTVPS